MACGWFDSDFSRHADDDEGIDGNFPENSRLRPQEFLSSDLTTSAQPQARAWSKGARVGSANYTPTAWVKVESATRGLKLRSATAWRPSMHNHHG